MKGSSATSSTLGCWNMRCSTTHCSSSGPSNMPAGGSSAGVWGRILRNYDYVSSMDFGAFDGSCTKECRDLIENDIIVSMFMKMMSLEGSQSLLAAAVFDRIKDKCSISVKKVVKAIIFDMIRGKWGQRHEHPELSDQFMYLFRQFVPYVGAQGF